MLSHLIFIERYVYLHQTLSTLTHKVVVRVEGDEICKISGVHPTLGTHTQQNYSISA